MSWIDPAMFTSNDKTWNTPRDLYERLNKEFNFVLDAAASDINHKAPIWYTAKDDALSQPWNLGGNVFVNPPYGVNTWAWCKKAYDESQGGVTVVMLLPSRTDTAWFHDWVLGKAEIRFLRGRLMYTDDQGNKKNRAPFPSLVAIYRPRGDEHESEGRE